MENKERYIMKENSFELKINDEVVCSTDYTVELSDEFFNENYVTLYNLNTVEEFRHKGFGKYFLNLLFKIIPNKFDIKLITLIVEKDNDNAIKLYNSVGFEVFQEYFDSYCIVKRL